MRSRASSADGVRAPRAAASEKDQSRSRREQSQRAASAALAAQRGESGAQESARAKAKRNARASQAVTAHEERSRRIARRIDVGHRKTAPPPARRAHAHEHSRREKRREKGMRESSLSHADRARRRRYRSVTTSRKAASDAASAAKPARAGHARRKHRAREVARGACEGGHGAGRWSRRGAVVSHLRPRSVRRLQRHGSTNRIHRFDGPLRADVRPYQHQELVCRRHDGSNQR